MIAVDYKEDSKKIVVTTLNGKVPIVRVTTYKISKVTSIEVFKEGSKEPIETYVYSKV